MVELRFGLRQPGNEHQKRLVWQIHSWIPLSRKWSWSRGPSLVCPLYMDFKSAQEEREAVSLTAHPSPGDTYVRRTKPIPPTTPLSRRGQVGETLAHFLSSRSPGLISGDVKIHQTLNSLRLLYPAVSTENYVSCFLFSLLLKCQVGLF